MGTDLLFEIGVEELPAAAARAAASQAGESIRHSLAERQLPVGEDQVRVMVSPRRITVIVSDLPGEQADAEVADRGPAARAAFDDDGKPTKAAEGFARSKGLAVEHLEVREHRGQDFVFAVRQVKGSRTLDLLPDVCRQVLASFAFPKTMRWDDSGLRFSRPVRWLVTKFGGETVTFEAEGLESSDKSRGHRFLAPGDVVIDDAGSYLRQLRDARVIADQEERRELIMAGLDAKAAAMGASYFDPAGEMEEVIYLVENPSVHTGSFREDHLRLPEEVLVTAMQSHQRYFPLRGADGDLVAAFLHVINSDPDHIDAVNEGNERVLEGRLEDAEFSYGKDLNTGIETMRDGLGKVVFHKRLGTMAQKSSRLENLVKELAAVTGGEDRELDTAIQAAGLAKADLVSIMVQEFPTLEGVMGAVYAAIDGYHADTCAAIREHYMPVAAGGDLPGSLPGALLSIGDKIDNLTGSFAVDEQPTGSRDPYGLRRAAVGIYEICRRFDLDFDLAALLRYSHRLYVDQEAEVNRDADRVTAAVIDFVYDRVRNRMVESGIPVGVVEAARASGLTSVLQLEKLVEALDSFRGAPAFEDFHTAYFRSSKIAARAEEVVMAEAVDASLFAEEEEVRLFEAVAELRDRIAVLLEKDDYSGALEAAAGIRPAVDAFFDAVMVMAEDEKLRRNRLALVSHTAATLQVLGDPMMVAAAPKDEAGTG